MSDTTLPDLLTAGHEPDFEAPPTVDDEDDFVLPPARGRLPRATVALGALAVLAIGVLGGVEVQKHEGTSTAAGAFAAARAGRTRTGAGVAGGTGFGAFAGAAGGTGTGGGAAGAGGGTTGTTTTTPAVAPIAIGTVVSLSGSTLVVKDLGGNTRTITLGSGVTLTTSAPLTASALKAGDTVTVSGTTAANGTSTATTVLRRTSH